MNLGKSNKIIIIASVLIILIVGELFISSVLYPAYIYAIPVTDAPHTSITAGIVAPSAIITANATAAVAINTIVKTVESKLEQIIKYAAYIVFFTIMNIMTNQIIDWINSDFKGKPAFVQNYKKLFDQALDNVAGSFIDQLGLGFLCEGIDINLIVPLLRVPTFSEKASCTLSSAMANIDEFKNKFDEGGFKAFLSLGSMSNNQIGATLMAVDELAFKKTMAASEKKEEIAFGDGFFSVKQCVDEQTLTDEQLYKEIDKRKKDPEDAERISDTQLKVCWKTEMKNPAQLMKEMTLKSGSSQFDQLQAQIADMTDSLGLFGPYVMAIGNALVNHLINKGFAELTKKDTSQSRSYYKIKAPKTEAEDISFSEQILRDLKNLRDNLIRLNQLKSEIRGNLLSVQAIQREILNMLRWILAYNHGNYVALDDFLNQINVIIERSTTINQQLTELMDNGDVKKPKADFEDKISTMISLADETLQIINELSDGSNPTVQGIHQEITLAKNYLNAVPNQIKPSQLLIYAASPLYLNPAMLKGKLQPMILEKIPSFVAINKIERLSGVLTQTTDVTAAESWSGLVFQKTADGGTVTSLPQTPSCGANCLIRTETTTQNGSDSFEISLDALGVADGIMKYKTSSACFNETTVKKTLVKSNGQPEQYAKIVPGSEICTGDSFGGYSCIYTYDIGIFTYTTQTQEQCGPVQSMSSYYNCQYFTTPIKIVDPETSQTSTVSCPANIRIFKAYEQGTGPGSATYGSDTTYVPSSINLLADIFSAVLPGNIPFIERLKTTISGEQTFVKTSELTKNLELASNATVALDPFQNYFDAANYFGSVDPLDTVKKSKAWQSLIEARNLAIDIVQPVIQQNDVDPRKISDEEDLEKITSAVSGKSQDAQSKSGTATQEKRETDEQLSNIYNAFYEVYAIFVAAVLIN